MENKLETKMQNLQKENEMLKQLVKMFDRLHRYSSDETEYVLLRKNDDPLLTKLMLQEICPKKKRAKLNFSEVLELLDEYGIGDLDDLQQTLYFTYYYKEENRELRNKIAKMKNSQVRYVVVENPKTKRRTIMEKLNVFSTTYRACPATSHLGYFQELEHFGEFATLEEAQIALKILKEEE